MPSAFVTPDSVAPRDGGPVRPDGHRLAFWPCTSWTGRGPRRAFRRSSASSSSRTRCSRSRSRSSRSTSAFPNWRPSQTNASLFEALARAPPGDLRLHPQLRGDRGVLGRPLPDVPRDQPDRRPALALNLGFLFCIAALPFPTSVIAQQGDVPVAAAFYAAFGVLTGTMSLILWRYPARAGLVIVDGHAARSSDTSRTGSRSSRSCSRSPSRSPS